MNFKQSLVETNGIQIRIAEQGEGPLVLFCHGFPEASYSWRHQVPALAEAGFHAVAPRSRRTSCFDETSERTKSEVHFTDL